MLFVNFENYFLISNVVLTLINYWFFFFKNNFIFLRNKINTTVKLKKVNILKKLNYRLFLNYCLLFNFFYFLSFFFIKNTSSTFWWNHFILTNFNLYVIYYLLILNGFFSILMYFISKNNVNFNYEYIFSLFLINIISPLIFLANTLFTLLFILECVSCLIFYKFTVSKFWFSKKKNLQICLNLSKFNKLLPKYYINMLFFQYWSTFFSSILIIYSLINLTFLFGTSEWFFLNYFYKINLNLFYFSKYEIFFLCFPLYFGIFIKMGVTPLHLYKIEVYKGIPFLSLFFYTTYYFFIYFIFIFVFFTKLILTFSIISWFFFFFILSCGCLYVFSLFFDIIFIKSFFAYSTIINSLNFIIIIFVSII